MKHKKTGGHKLMYQSSPVHHSSERPRWLNLIQSELYPRQQATKGDLMLVHSLVLQSLCQANGGVVGGWNRIFCEVLLNAVNDLMVFWDGETVFPPVVDESIPVYPLLVDNIE